MYILDLLNKVDSSASTILLITCGSILSKIFFSHDVIPTIEEAIGNGLIPETEKEQFENYIFDLYWSNEKHHQTI